MENINNGKVNLMEYFIISAIILYLESIVGKAHILDVKNFYDMIFSLVRTYNILLPITCLSLCEIDKAIRQVFSVRKGMR